MEIISYKGYEIQIEEDNNPINPRTEEDHLGKMVCFHRRYNLGDKTDYRSDNYSSFSELLDEIKENENVIAVAPIYMYDHGGITISCGPFDCPFDSDQIGFIYANRKDIQNCFGVKNITKKVLSNVEKILEEEVKSYDNYLTGNIYGYTVIDPDEDEIDSCWGYEGDDNEYMVNEAKSSIDYDIKRRISEKTKQLKKWILNKVPLEHRTAGW